MLKHKLKKIYKYEYWSFWAFYAPLTPFYLWFSLKNRSLLYFCRVNPNMKNGGFTEYSKSEIQKQIPQVYRPKEQVVFSNEDFKLNLKFPIVAKPDIGERGKNVTFIYNLDELNFYLNKFENEKIILQEVLTEPKEYGLFFIKYPNQEKGKILNITGKEFLTYKGDGKQSLKDFILNNERAFFRKSYLLEKYHCRLDEVLPKGENLILEKIGNHNRGTYFYDATDLNTTDLENAVHLILKDIKGFHYGRLDVKTKSEEDLKNGNIKIIEVNGANSEATHIYDNKYSIFQAYREVLKTLNHQSNIALAQKRNGVKAPSIISFLKDLKTHFSK
ncbi:hypothetical protein KRX57_03280 [Weeksellaceae bacterium TAE3-ERU29]|nr:hypothetical protein [Weeksellaceae bacterium TAE3-ERU29]